jgi:hypothetical protein
MSPTQHVSKVGYDLHSVQVYFQATGFNSKKARIEIYRLQNVTISISMALLLNTIKFGFIPVCSKSRGEDYRCRVPNEGWILGIY